MREWERDDGPEIRQHGQLQGAGALDWRAELASAGSSAWLVIAMAALRYGVVLRIRPTSALPLAAAGVASQRIRRRRDWPSLPAAVLTAPVKGRRWSWEEERPGARTPLNRLSKNGLKHPVHVHTKPCMPSRKHQRVDKAGTGRRRRRRANCPDIPLPKTTGEIKPNIYAATPHAPPKSLGTAGTTHPRDPKKSHAKRYLSAPLLCNHQAHPPTACGDNAMPLVQSPSTPQLRHQATPTSPYSTLSSSSPGKSRQPTSTPTYAKRHTSQPRHVHVRT